MAEHRQRMPLPSPCEDLLGNDRCSPLGEQPLLWHDAAAVPDALPAWAIHVGLDAAGALPSVDAGRLDVLLTTCPDAPAPWVSIPVARLAAQRGQVEALVTAAPIAATTLARLLRLGDVLSFEAALDVESLAYSMLLSGGEFARWLAARKIEPSSMIAPLSSSLVRYEREGDHVTLWLASPGNRNAMTAAMRDALYEALANVLEDPSCPSVEIRGEGRCFSTGGHLPEFGTARDPAAAHVVRTLRGCAGLLHRLGERASVRLQGACVGSGIEVAAAARHRIAAPDMFAQLPELKMGLIPGAGGTVTLARAIGRHRLLWMVLGAFRIGAVQAQAWGLVDRVEA